MGDEPHFRRGGRRSIALRVRFRAGAALEHEGTTVDIGLGGAFVRTRALPEVGQELTLHLESPSAWEALEIVCRVCWVSDGRDGTGQGFGVKFEELSEVQGRALYELLQATGFGGGEA